MKKITALLLFTLFLTTITGTVIAQDEPIVLGEGDWPGLRAKDAVAKSILENIGYETEITFTQEPLIYQGLAQDDIDVFLGNWMPATRKKREAVKDKIEVVATNMDNCVYTLGVPTYVYEQGVKNISDLHKYAEKFDKKVYVGKTGWDTAINMKKAKKNNTYNLGEWNMITSGQSALMAHVKKAMKDKEWVAFVAWTPHWMAHILDIKFLKDPESEIWKSVESYVDTLARKEFKDIYPEPYKFIKQYDINIETANKWIFELGRKDRDAEVVAEEWIKNNISTVEKWLKGVKASNGENAIKVLKENMNIN